MHLLRHVVASLVACLAFFLDRASKRARELADVIAAAAGRIAPEPIAVVFEPPVRKPDAPTFTVLRWVGRRYWTLYTGEDGGKARRAYEAVERAGEKGRMEFQMTDPAVPGGYVVRAVYGEAST